MTNNHLQSSKNNICVSVIMMTYNHADFVDQAVKSVLDQVCSFPYELIIGDDCSTDKTLEIVEHLQSESPATIHLLPSKINLGIIPNFQRLMSASQGKYIAMLEGDDYWVDMNKLQEQFEMMERDSSLSLCVGKTQNRQFWGKIKSRYSLNDLLRRYIFHTSTLFFRKHDVPDFTKYTSIHALDSLLIAFLAEKGDCGFINKEMSYYRRHQGGAWSGKKFAECIEATQDVTDVLSAHFKGRLNRQLLDRELWVYKLMSTPDLSKPIFPQWRNNLSLIRHVVRRTLPAMPTQSLVFLFAIIPQPVIFFLQSWRFKLGLGEKLRAFIPPKTGS